MHQFRNTRLAEGQEPAQADQQSGGLYTKRRSATIPCDLERFEAKDPEGSHKRQARRRSIERLVASAKAKTTPRKDNGYIPLFRLTNDLRGRNAWGGKHQQIEELKACANALLSTHRRAIVSNLVDRCPDLFDYRALPTLAQGLTSIERFEAAKKLITCIDSLNHSIHSAGNCSRDLIEIDEAFASFASAAMPKNGSDQDGRIIDRIALLEALLTSCRRSIFAEAALDPCTPRLVGTLDTQSQQEPLRVKWDGSRWISAEGTLPSAETPVVWAEFINKHPFKWRFSPTEDALLAHLESAFLAGEKLAIFVVHKSDVEGLAHRVKTLRPNAKGLLMHGDLGLEDRERAATQAAWA
ncbi:MAG: hypothetical protein IPO41_12890 [Acidobacteria bacterium]|nr:hypothetical protein [Acidobacteriota bacterium]